MLIDSHHHLWAYDPAEYPWINHEMAVLKQDFLAAELREIAGEHGVDGFISVQARQSVAETQALLDIAAAEPLVAGVVGWAPFAAPDVAALIDQFAENGKLKGFRHVVQDEPDDRFLDRADFNAGIRALADRHLVFDLLVFPKQLAAAIDFADRHPDIPMVLDHIAKPAIAAEAFDGIWREQFCELAKRKNVACKFSGVATEVREASWSIDTIRPYWDVAVSAFGTDRLMYGSDWPVCLLATQYGRWLDTVHQLAAEFAEAERAQFYSGNATRIYRLDRK
ncbi:amidohydrolase family protein [Allorhodopirellula heiligendammensis]|uniref:Amidohydrolase n=1 Tax=Allorhodopirellula heiligendammensis TaxID=2714739 RepID=A0A5C6BY65_9BACT|nr:amidohydrolase family protein [Allorhodopirellula heiligendammensis]TWU15579.1 Amidohydrolase [Allorhodopirellula heiligendammensis]